VFVLGKGASFGKDKLGDEKRIGELSKKMKFKTKYLKKFALDKQPISSGYIRHLIDGGDFIFASKLLGRPFSIYATPHRNKDHSDTYTISLNGLCMPPHGTYAISAFIAEQEYEGTAIVDRNQQILNFKVNNLPNKLEKSPVEIIFQKYFSSNLA
jgi:riboflavin kinase/FMN adenylyltransferase